jgi:hypothetical protein
MISWSSVLTWIIPYIYETKCSISDKFPTNVFPSLFCSHQNLGKTQPIQIHEHENIPQQKRARQWGSGETPVEKRYRRRGGAGEFRRQRKGTGFTSTTGGRSHALHLRSIAMDDD